MNNEFEGLGKAAILSQFKVLFVNLLGETAVNCNRASGYLVRVPAFKPGSPGCVE